MSKISDYNFLNTPRKILIIGILISSLLIIFSLPFLETTVWRCTDALGDRCFQAVRENIIFTDWYLSLDGNLKYEEISFRLIILISISLAITFSSIAYYFIMTSPDK